MGDTECPANTVGTVKARLASLLCVLLVLLVTVSTLELVESRLRGEITIDGPLPNYPPQEPPVPSSGVSTYPSLTFDPVIEVSDPYLWQRENQFLLMDQARRVGWGPDLVDQTPREMRGDPLRVLVVGDSFVWGQGVEDLDNRWDKILQRELDVRTRPGTFEVVALGKGGSSTMNMAEWFSQDRVTRLDPDALVIGFISNDFWPTFTEKHFCVKLNLCVPDGGAPAVDCGPRCDIAACLLGEGTPLGWFLRDVMNPRYPNVTTWLLHRYCDPDRIASRRGLLTEHDSIDDPKSSPYWSLFEEAVQGLGDAGGDIPRFVVHTRTRPFFLDRLDPTEAVFLEHGFRLTPMTATYDVIKAHDSRDLVVNPADTHPNALLTSAYAVDAAQAIVEQFTERIAAMKPVPADMAPIVSNYLPTSMSPEPAGDKSFSFLFDPESASRLGQGARATVNGTSFPRQLVPCARMGRPHARIMLDRSLPAGSIVQVRLRSPSSLVLLPVGTAANGSQIQGQPVVLAGDGSTEVSIGNGVHGFLLGTTKAGCPAEDEITLPPFRLSIDLLAPRG